MDYTEEAGWDVYDRAIFREQRDKVLREVFPEEYTRTLKGQELGLGEVYTDFWHTVPDWNRLIDLGFRGILDDAVQSKEALLQGGAYEDKQINFLDSVIITFGAILRCMERMYQYSLKFDVPEFSACLKNLISNPPKTLYEVLQFAVLYLYFEEIGCERGRTLGAIDRLYFPFYQKELQKGTPLEEIKELFRYFFIHFTATKRFAQQPFAIAGCDKDGNDYSNELTMLLLDVYDEMNIYDPKIHLRYHKNLDDKVFTKVISMIRKGNSSICMVNDGAVFAGYERLGIPVEDSQDYVLLGCYEPVIIGKEEAEIAITWLNMAKCIEFVLNHGRDLRTDYLLGLDKKFEITNFEDFFTAFLQQLDHCLEFAIDFAQRQGFIATQINPTPIYSASFKDCIEKGMDVHEYPLKYNNMSIKCFGLATVVDSMMAIKKYVFEQKLVSLDEFKEVLKNNWEGYEDLRNMILKDKEKYGNHCEEPDQLAVRITRHLEDNYLGRKLQRGGVLRLGLDSIDHCVWLGECSAATPDGRLAGMPISKNLCAVEGKDRGGITAYMQSVLKIHADAFVDSAILDFMLHPSAVEGEKGLEDFKSLIKVFFQCGGFAAQGNIVSGETLKEAQLHPEQYSTLQIRVCGWNEYFVKLCKSKQDMFIRQYEV